MTKTTRELFEEHVNDILGRVLVGDADAAKTLACMALLVDGFPPGNGEGEPVIDLAAWRVRLAA